MLVIDICKLPKIGASKLKRFLISNWSSGKIYIICVIRNNHIYLDTTVIWFYKTKINIMDNTT